METYVILRRSGFGSRDELKDAVERSRAACTGMPDDVRWIRSYVLDEPTGALGTVCIIESSSEEAIHVHAGRADLPVDEILRVSESVVVREDPVPAAG
jgi:Protein of unknown function (DUF4242)